MIQLLQIDTLIITITYRRYEIWFDTSMIWLLQIDNPISDDDDSDFEEDLLEDKKLQQELEDNTQVYGICSVVDLQSKEVIGAVCLRNQIALMLLILQPYKWL